MTTPAPPAEHRAPAGKRAPAEKRILGMPRSVVIVGGIAFAAALGYLLWKRSQANAAATAAAANTAATSTTGTNAVDNGQTDYGGELSVIQTELESVLANQQGGSSTTTTTGTGTGTTTTGTGGPTGGPGGGHVVSVNNNDATIAWNANGATSWDTRIVGPGPINGHTGHTTVPQAVYSGLSAGHNYQVFVTPHYPNGSTGAPGIVHFVTTSGKKK